jgi:hypothetical protein
VENGNPTVRAIEFPCGRPGEGEGPRHGGYGAREYGRRRPSVIAVIITANYVVTGGMTTAVLCPSGPFRTRMSIGDSGGSAPVRLKPDFQPSAPTLGDHGSPFLRGFSRLRPIRSINPAAFISTVSVSRLPRGEGDGRDYGKTRHRRDSHATGRR